MLVAALALEVVLTPAVSVAMLTVVVGTKSGKLDVPCHDSAAEVVVDRVAFVELVANPDAAVVDAAAKTTVLVGLRSGETFWVVYVLSVARSTVVDGTRSGKLEVVVSRLASVIACRGMRTGETVCLPLSSVAMLIGLEGARSGKEETAAASTGLTSVDRAQMARTVID